MKVKFRMFYLAYLEYNYFDRARKEESKMLIKLLLRNCFRSFDMTNNEFLFNQKNDRLNKRLSSLYKNSVNDVMYKGSKELYKNVY